MIPFSYFLDRGDSIFFRKFKYLVFVLFFAFSGCFLFGEMSNPGKVKGYSPGTVKTDKGSYAVGPLPVTWRRGKVGKYKVLVFYNDAYHSSIETDAFCDQSFDDASLRVLTSHLHAGLTKPQTKSETPMMLNGRGALRSIAEGTVDGIPMRLDSVVIKKDNCLFDFVLIAQPSFYSSAVADFESFFGGFHYTGDI